MDLTMDDEMKTIVITGANVGIGFATAKFLAATPNRHVVLACRDERKAKAAVDASKSTHPSSHLSFAPLDLFSLASVRRLPAALAAMSLPPIAGLILNAGGNNLMAKAPAFTEDGFEQTFQLNFLGHFLLANLFVTCMAPLGRIVFVSSDLHDPAATKMGRIAAPRYGSVEDLARGTGAAANMKPIVRYATAKMYAVMMAYELDRRLRRAKIGIAVNSWSPGVVPTTQFGRNAPPIMRKIVARPWFVKFMGSHLSTEEEAGRALGSLAVDAKYSDVSGKYFFRFEETLSSVESRDESKAQSVWKQSVELAGLSQEEAEYSVFPRKAPLGHRDYAAMVGKG
jgi:NAD(P)-dependent dehydrogenase (short-subunit alcohol dehydrogenase family)